MFTNLQGTKNFEKTLQLIIVLVGLVIVISLYSLSFWHFQTPWRRMNYDAYTQLSQMQIWETSNRYKSELFPGLFQSDLRTQYYLRGWVSLGKTFNWTHFETNYVMGLFNLGSILLGIFLWARLLKFTPKQFLWWSIIIAFSLASFWEENEAGYTMLSLPDLMINSSYPQILGVGLLLIAVWSCWQWFERTDRYRFGYLAIVGILLLSLVGLHLFTAGILAVLLGILASTKIFQSQRNLKSGIWLGLIIILVLGITAFTPGISWLDYVLRSAANLQSSPIGQGTADPKYFSLTVRAGTLGLALIGLPLLMRKKLDNFMKLWILGFSLVSLSYVLPFKIPYFWRFTAFIRIPLSYLVTLLLSERIAGIGLIRILLIVALCLPAFGLWQRNLSSFNDVKQIEFIGNYHNQVILADPIESNYIIGATNNQAIAIPYGHITEPSILAVNQQRMQLLDGYYQGKQQSFEALLSQFQPELILVNKFSDLYNYRTLTMPLSVDLTYENEKYILYRIK